MRMSMCWFVVGLVAGSGCVDLCPGATREIGEKGRFRVRILEPYAQGGAFDFKERVLGEIRDLPSCGALDGLVAGLEFDVHVVGKETPMYACQTLVGRIVNPPPALARAGFSSGSLQGFVSSLYFGRIGECEGAWALAFESVAEAGPYARAMPGAAPPVIALREFQPLAKDAESQSCVRCGDAYVVQLEKLR